MSNLNDFYKDILSSNNRYASWPYAHIDSYGGSNRITCDVVVTFQRDRGHLRIKKVENERDIKLIAKRTKTSITKDPPHLIFNVGCTAEEFIDNNYDPNLISVEGNLEEINMDELVHCLRAIQDTAFQNRTRRSSIVA